MRGHGDLQCCGVDCFSEAVNEIPPCGVVVISNSAVFYVCVFYATVIGEMRLFGVLQ